MSSERIISDAFDGRACPLAHPEVKVVTDSHGRHFPVLLSKDREHRPFRQFVPFTSEDCPLCERVRAGRTSAAIVEGMAWFPATYPIKSLHGISCPVEHRATILAADITALGQFVDRSGDAVLCVNLRGSGASLPGHYHAQTHDDKLQVAAPDGVVSATAFPLLTYPVQSIFRNADLVLAKIPEYPTFVLVLQGPWDVLGRWLVAYLSSSNTWPHNFALASGRRLFAIPRRLERAPTQENRYGASEMLGLITPVTRAAYDAITNGDVVAEALRACGLDDSRERVGVEEHALWVLRHVSEALRASTPQSPLANVGPGMLPGQITTEAPSRRYLVRREHSCAIVFDRVTGQWDWIWPPEAEKWVRRTDVECIDYRDLPQSAKHVALGAPLKLFLDVTSACQCQCWYCYNPCGQPGTDDLMSDDIKALIVRFADIGGMELRLAGGEPTLHPQLLDFIALATDRALRTIVVSNGLIGDDLLHSLARTSVSAYFLSLQGDQEAHDLLRGPGAYERCLHSAVTLCRAGANVRLSMVFHKSNQHCVEHVVAVAAEIGANVAFNPLRPFGRASSGQMLSPEDHYRLVRRVTALRGRFPSTRIDTPWDFLMEPAEATISAPYKHIGCGDVAPTVTARGDYYSCGQLCSRREFCLGNVRSEDLHALWLRSRVECPIFNASVSKKCSSCRYLYGSRCFGGCPATALAVNGALDGDDPYCFVQLIQGKAGCQ